MPYRRLPNTDLARMRALRAALGKDPQGEVITPALQQEASAFLSQMEKTHRYYRACCENQAKAKRKHQESLRVARLYVSHFIQVLDLAVLRGEIKKEQKQYYGLSAANGLPDLASEGALLRWGKLVMEGERQRTAHGGIPIYNPTIARVKVYYDLFVESMERQKGTQRETANALRAWIYESAGQGYNFMDVSRGYVRAKEGAEHVWNLFMRLLSYGRSGQTTGGGSGGEIIVSAPNFQLTWQLVDGRLQTSLTVQAPNGYTIQPSHSDVTIQGYTGGTHDELMQLKGWYYHQYLSQQMEEV